MRNPFVMSEEFFSFSTSAWAQSGNYQGAAGCLPADDRGMQVSTAESITGRKKLKASSIDRSLSSKRERESRIAVALKKGGPSAHHNGNGKKEQTSLGKS